LYNLFQPLLAKRSGLNLQTCSIITVFGADELAFENMLALQSQP
jgi:hypothetical protein